MGIDAQGNLDIAVNEDLVFAERWTDETGTPYLLSDAKLQVRHSIDDTVVMLEASVTNGRITLDNVNGWATVFVDEEVLTASFMSFGVMRFDLVVTRTSDAQTKVLGRGLARVRRGVTRD